MAIPQVVKNNPGTAAAAAGALAGLVFIITTNPMYYVGHPAVTNALFDWAKNKTMEAGAQLANASLPVAKDVAVAAVDTTAVATGALVAAGATKLAQAIKWCWNKAHADKAPTETTALTQPLNSHLTHDDDSDNEAKSGCCPRFGSSNASV